MSDSQRSTMDFFGAQALHRRNTAQLLGYFTAAVSITATAAYVLAALYWFVFNHTANFWRDLYGLDLVDFEWWNLRKYAIIAIPMAVGLTGVSVWKTLHLSAPIDLVMKLLGACEVNRGIKHPPTRQYVDVVEEMSIASSTPMPRTFVIPKQYGINAMAVGWSKDDAAIAVSGGAIQMLTRDEMQGVVAHEFSHILNGDMAMNVKLLGVLHGIDALGVTGRVFVRFLVKSGQVGIPGHSNVVAMGSWVALIMSLPFAALSWVGVALGQLIRAAISRQREYLADASAVQFTRYAEGIAGALKKIGGLTAGSSISSAALHMTSHFFFASSLAKGEGFFSTASHPPISDRVLRVDPSFDGEFAYVPPYYEAKMGDVKDAAWKAGAMAKGGVEPTPAITTSDGTKLMSDDLITALTTPDPGYNTFCRKVFNDLAAPLASAARTPESALSVVYALLLDAGPERRSGQLQSIKESEGSDVADATAAAAQHLKDAGPAAEVPLLETALKSLKELSRPELKEAYDGCKTAFPLGAAADSNHFVFLKAITSRLASLTGKRPKSGLAVKAISSVEEELLAITAYLLKWKKAAGTDDSKLMASLPMLAGIDLDNVDTSPAALERAFMRLGSANPQVKQEILVLTTRLLAPDGNIGIAEAEMAWLLAELLRARIPPLVPGTIRKRLRK